MQKIQPTLRSSNFECEASVALPSFIKNVPGNMKKRQAVILIGQKREHALEYQTFTQHDLCRIFFSRTEKCDFF